MVCDGCLEKQRKIDSLEEEVKIFKVRLRYRERNKEDGFFGSSTLSSKLPIKRRDVRILWR